MNARRELADETEPEASTGAGAGNLGLTVPPKTTAKRTYDCLDLREATHGAMATRYVFRGGAGWRWQREAGIQVLRAARF